MNGWIVGYTIGLLGLSPLLHATSQATPSTTKRASSDFQAKDYSYLFGMPGFSDQLLKLHFQLYQGYVKNTNQVLARLKELELQDRDQTYEYGALKRRLGWEYDGMRLHEFYFENLGGVDSLEKSNPLYQALTKEFGSYEGWKKNFGSIGMIRGIGWVILYRDRQTGRLFNTWINEHDLGHLVGGDPLLVMDVFEHAYITQYGLDRGKYIGAFFDNVNWAKVAKRYQDALRTPAP
jgi:Fe-Mn family superoxide dismutase